MDDNLLAEAARLAQGPKPGDAVPLVERLLGEAPDDPEALTVAALVAQRTGRGDEAVRLFAAARDADADNPSRHQNLAVALKRLGRFDEALAAFETALALRPRHGATIANMGSCLLAAGRNDEALARLDPAGVDDPAHADFCNNRGIALARAGRFDEAVEAYRGPICARPAMAETQINMADALAQSGDAAGAMRVLEEVLAAGSNMRAANQLGLLKEKAGDFAAAAAALRSGFDPDAPNHALGINLARNLIRADRPRDALAVCERMLATSPSVTTPLAMATVALGRMGERGAQAQLMGIEYFVTVHDIDAVSGFATIADFNAALVAELRDHPSLTEEPEGLVTRQGRQSDDLAAAQTPALAALGDLARERLAAEGGRLRGWGGNHPFLRALPEHWSLTLWGTILRPGGEVGAHIHAPNWMSGVYYPDFTGNPDDGREGAFGIGVLPEELGGDAEPLQVFTPRTGRLILFPSYLWHATLPFGGEEDRISFAFDLVPEGVGRAHSLS